MRLRPAAVVLLALILVAPACKGDGGGAAPTAARGQLGALTSSTLPDPSADPGPSSTTVAAGAAGATTTRPPTPATTSKGAATTAAPAASADPKAAAEDALNTYLDGLRTEAYGSAMSASTGGPRLLAFVRSLLKDLNTQAGASSTFEYTERRYAPAATTADRVVFSGRAVLRQTTTPKSGAQKTAQVTLGEIAVLRKGPLWLVNELVWEGKPVEYSPSTAQADLGNGVTARLAGAVRFGGITSLVLGFKTDKQLAIRIENDKLHSTGFDDASNYRALVSGFALFNYPRRAPTPKSWSGLVTVGGGTPRSVSMAFS